MSTAELHRSLESSQKQAEAPRPIVSKYASDPVLGPILQEYIADLPAQLTELSEAVRSGDMRQTCHLSHRLKGDSATYGFPELSHVAHEIEQLTRGAEEPPAAGQLLRLVAALQIIGRRICAGAAS